jgi:hypothetical protein
MSPLSELYNSDIGSQDLALSSLWSSEGNLVYERVELDISDNCIGLVQEQHRYR